MSLPSTYQKVEYIESSGTQYINTGVNANQYLSYEADFQATGNTTNTTLFGARTGSSTNRFGLMIYSNKFHMMIGNTSAFNTSVDTNRHKCSVFMNNGAFTSKIDGTVETGSVGTEVYANQNFFLFKIDYGSDGVLPYKLYSFKLYTGNSTLVRAFVPVLRKSDNKPGLYDTVNNVFYTNGGTGEFLYGPKVSDALERAVYLGTNKIWPEDQICEYEYTYDFRSKSVSTMKSDGWIFTNGESYAVVDANGIKGVTPTSTGENNPYFYKLIDPLTNAKYIEIEAQFYGSTASWGSTNYAGICSNLTGRSVTESQEIGFSLMTSSGYTNRGSLNVHTASTGVNVAKYTTSVSSGTHKFLAKIDLETGAAEFQRDSETPITGTVSSEYISSIKNCDSMWCRVGHDTGQIYTQYLTIRVKENCGGPTPTPTEVVEEYTNVPMGSNLSIQKTGYKIKEVIYEWVCYYCCSDWKNGGMNLFNDVTDRINLHVNIQLGGTWGYDYGTYGAYNGYGVERTNQTTQAIIKGNSSGGNKNNCAGYMKTTIDKTEYKFGTSTSNWTQTGTATHNSTVQSWLTNLFSGTNLYISRNARSNQNYFTSHKITITWEPI